MTIQEAFEIIKNEMPYESGVINEALKTVEGAVGKQIPRKPKHKQHGYDCAVCGCYLGDEIVLKYLDLRCKYCPNCGQAIDWSELKE